MNDQQKLILKALIILNIGLFLLGTYLYWQGSTLVNEQTQNQQELLKLCNEYYKGIIEKVCYPRNEYIGTRITNFTFNVSTFS